MIGFSHQPSVLTLNGFWRQQLKLLEIALIGVMIPSL
jgi:hypothetical protein